jgi:hypothetical protein
MQSTWRRHISKRKALEDDRVSVCGWYDGILQCEGYFPEETTVARTNVVSANRIITSEKSVTGE